jgi:hypothetical protein
MFKVKGEVVGFSNDCLACFTKAVELIRKHLCGVLFHNWHNSNINVFVFSKVAEMPCAFLTT